MARIRPVFFHCVETLLKSRRSGKSWVIQPLLALITALLCTVVSPVLAKSPVINAVSSLPSSPTTTLSLVQQGKTLYDEGQFFEAVKVLQQAVQAYQAHGDRLKQAITLSNLSLAYQQLGLWSEATKAITDSLNLLQSGQNRGDSEDRLKAFAQTLNTQGRLHLTLGQPEQALTTWQQAATTYDQAGDTAGITRSLINQAQALQALGLYRRAKTMLTTQVNETLQKQPDSLIKTAGLRHLGNALRVVGDLDESRKFLQQSLVMAQQLRSPPDISAALLGLGNVARVQQDTQAALAFYQQAAIASVSQTTKLQAQLNQLNLLLQDLCGDYEKLPKYGFNEPQRRREHRERRGECVSTMLEAQQVSAAQTLWPQIQSQLANLPPSHNAIYARIDFAQSLTRLRELASSGTPTWSEIAQFLATAGQQAKSLGDQRAEAYALGSLGKLYEQAQQWSSAQDLTSLALLKAQAINAPDIAYSWQWQLGRLLKTQGDIPGAIAAYTEAISTLQSLRSDLVAINPDVQFDFRKSVEPVYRELVELLLRSVGISEPSQDNLMQARNVIESLQLAELDNFFREACLDAKRKIDEVVDQEQTAAVFYPIILEDRLELIVKLPKQKNLRHYQTPVEQEKVESTLKYLREYLLDVTRTSQVKEQSQQVYDWLIRPAEAELANSGIKTLVFVLDGSLRNIPMGVLYDKQQKKYLVEKYAIALTPGLQLIDPKPLQRVQLNALTAGMDEKRQVEGREFARLENVAIELREVQSEVPKSEELLNQKFTKINLQNQLKSANFSVVHIATHGEFSSNPEKTFILSWDKLLNVRDLDNLLQVSDQSRSSTIELLVLSACQTAQGDTQAALGLAGVAVRAGARSTLATLWSVDDESTTELMSQFYRELKTGVTKAEALQHAQLAVLNNEKRPYFWAPYVLVGNWL